MTSLDFERWYAKARSDMQLSAQDWPRHVALVAWDAAANKAADKLARYAHELRFNPAALPATADRVDAMAASVRAMASREAPEGLPDVG